MKKLRNAQKKRPFQMIFSLMAGLLPNPGLFISVKDPNTGGKMVIVRKMERLDIPLHNN